MFEDLSEKYTDVLSMQTPPFIGIWQRQMLPRILVGNKLRNEDNIKSEHRPCHIQDLGVLYLKHNQKGTMDISLLL